MHITLIGTVHIENGFANVRALSSVLEHLQPEVIYAEIPAAKLQCYVDGSHGNLESTAVSQYLKTHSTIVLPVDVEAPIDDFFFESEEMFKKIERTSFVYRNLLDQHHSDTRNDGFVYLNSTRCLNTWTEIYKEIFSIVQWIGHPKLLENYERWKEINDLREMAMLKNIEEHSVETELNRAVLLVGVAHKQELLTKIKNIKTLSYQRFFET